MSSYQRIGAVALTCRILKHLKKQREPQTAPEIARALDIPTGTVACHLATLEDEAFVRSVGAGWEIGLELAEFWVWKKRVLEYKRERIARDLEALSIETGGDA